jgi:hypothetical protein
VPPGELYRQGMGIEQAAEPCQVASNSDPHFASNLDPLVMACAGSP